MTRIYMKGQIPIPLISIHRKKGMMIAKVIMWQLAKQVDDRALQLCVD